MNFADLLARQKEFFQTGVTLSLAFRIAQLKKLRAAVIAHEEEIAEALKEDLGKSTFESYMCETGLALSEITYMIRHTKRFSKERRVKTPLAQFASRSYQKPSPYGNMLIMSPWNYPLMLTLDPLVDALAAGNTAVLKPSAYSPATTELLCRLIRQGFPEEYVAVITGGREENNYLLELKFDYIFFTINQCSIIYVRHYFTSFLSSSLIFPQSCKIELQINAYFFKSH